MFVHSPRVEWFCLTQVFLHFSVSSMCFGIYTKICSFPTCGDWPFGLTFNPVVLALSRLVYLICTKGEGGCQKYPTGNQWTIGKMEIKNSPSLKSCYDEKITNNWFLKRWKDFTDVSKNSDLFFQLIPCK